MGTPKKSSKKPHPSLLSDPLQNTALLTEQLRSLGLYAAPTLGDGNCLFRALSDQLYGSPSRHPQLRKDVCDWIARHKAATSPTYGGHMELSAFAHLTRRNVKVIQPGLVYVIEWAAGASSPSSPTSPTSPASPTCRAPRRRVRARRRRQGKQRPAGEDEVIDVDAGGDGGADGDVYHDWEHFSSIRNLKGPHTGLPGVRETPPHPYPPSPTYADSKQSKLDAKERKKLAKPVPKVRLKLSSASPTKAASPVLPASAARLAEGKPGLRVQRSPKRSFDESSGSAGSESESVAKRTRSAYAPATRQSRAQARRAAEEEDDEDDAEDRGRGRGTGRGRGRGRGRGLSLSPPALSSSSSLSSLSSMSPSPPPPDKIVPAPPAPKTMTRRQRKALGLPKTRAAAAAAGKSTGGGAGKIVIPGGRHEEWRRNGTGRVDVRGFRELKI
ncbi:hypothetical protein B0H17DRAFT_1173371 [Mycena rosella]|uniref:OTU domain-containing protein n=1 Tax=Mycena rosella TaxID=1033263 RepID=A0AAD7AYR3_MYCRO|nr:hypothetical protein B0H17DRAFT_1173371 [Mycena rosella]